MTGRDIRIPALLSISLGACAVGLPLVGASVRFANHEALEIRGLMLVAIGIVAIGYLWANRIMRQGERERIVRRSLLTGSVSGMAIAGWSLYVFELTHGHPERLFTLIGGSVFGIIFGVPAALAFAAMALPLLIWVANESARADHDFWPRAWGAAGRLSLVLGGVGLTVSLVLMPQAAIVSVLLGGVASAQLVIGGLCEARR